MENDNLRHGMFLFTEAKIASACAKTLPKLKIDGHRALSRVNVVDEERFQDLRTKQLSDMDSSDFAFLADAYLQKRDRANYAYYDYLKTYGTAGAKKPLRKENGDLIFPLAVSMGITELLPVDDKGSFLSEEYLDYWSRSCH